MVYPVRSDPGTDKPSERDFLHNVFYGKTKEVAESLRLFPDLVNLRDVNDLCYTEEDCPPFDCVLALLHLWRTLVTRQPSIHHHCRILFLSTVMI